MTEEELLELLLVMTPESFGGWVAIVVTASAFLSFVLPKPDDNAHPLIKVAHKVICVLGMGAGKLKTAGRLGKIGKIANLIRRKP